ncbi:ATP-binding protein [Hominifimenecus sp. rT4P-3]|uniref:sensor histidine kinase n=1 Tax=Hominifimenecus sp. rT4P-3 TaxID=3242979 RepID=UPI003DA2AA29
MKRRIFRSMCLVSFLGIFITALAIAVLLYQEFYHHMEDELQTETEYLAQGVESAGKTYLEMVRSKSDQNRLTLIDVDGTVLYDSETTAEMLDNHLERPEVRDALTWGSGKHARLSDTMGQQIFYYALRLSDGTVLRVSKAVDSVFRMALGCMPYFIGIALLAAGAAMFLSKKQTVRIIQPINNLDLENPMQQELYAELEPLLLRIDRQKAERQKTEQQRQEFSANVSHELKTPLQSIVGYAELLQNGMVKAADVPRFSERIYRETRRLIVLVEDIIRLSQLDEGREEQEDESIDILALAKEVVSRFEESAVKKKITITIEGIPVKIVGSRRILDEMIANLCDNAIKYNRENGVVNVRIESDETGALLTLEDTGIGIPEESKERVFERFYRVDKSRSKETGGTGLGLSIVKHGAQYHQGKVTLTSDLGKGTRISIHFPKERIDG